MDDCVIPVELCLLVIEMLYQESMQWASVAGTTQPLLQTVQAHVRFGRLTCRPLAVRVLKHKCEELGLRLVMLARRYRQEKGWQNLEMNALGFEQKRLLDDLAIWHPWPSSFGRTQTLLVSRRPRDGYTTFLASFTKFLVTHGFNQVTVMLGNYGACAQFARLLGPQHCSLIDVADTDLSNVRGDPFWSVPLKDGLLLVDVDITTTDAYFAERQLSKNTTELLKHLHVACETLGTTLIIMRGQRLLT